MSTQEVAGLLAVTETTVKRWSDDGLIPCLKSPGGHRKFRLPDLIEFAEKHGYKLSESIMPPVKKEQMESIQFAIHTQNYYKISQLLFDEALHDDPEALYRLLHYLSKHNVKLSTLADEILRPLMVRIGDLWVKGKLRVDQEHRASRAVMQAITRLSPQLHKKPPLGRTAICACPEGDHHEIGLLSLSFALQAEGFDIVLIGSDTPTDVLVTAIRKHKPDLFCLSFMAEHPEPELLKTFATIARAVRSEKGKFIAGGYFAGNFRDADLPCDYLASSVTDGIAYIRDAFSLKPGPRKTTRSN